MSSPGYAPALWLECRGNPWLRAIYGLFAFLCVFSVWLLPWPWWQQSLAWLLLVVLLWQGWRGRCELGGPALRLHWDEDGQWWCYRHNPSDGHTNVQAMVLEREQLLSSVVIVLRLRPQQPGNAPLAVLLTPAAVGVSTFRRLGLRLRQAEEPVTEAS